MANRYKHTNNNTDKIEVFEAPRVLQTFKNLKHFEIERNEKS